MKPPSQFHGPALSSPQRKAAPPQPPRPCQQITQSPKRSPPAKGHENLSSLLENKIPAPRRGFCFANPLQSSSAIHARFILGSYLYSDGKGFPLKPHRHPVCFRKHHPGPTEHRFSPPSLTSPRLPRRGLLFLICQTAGTTFHPRPPDPEAFFATPC